MQTVEQVTGQIIETAIVGTSSLIDAVQTQEWDKCLAVLLGLADAVRGWGEAVIFCAAVTNADMETLMSPTADRKTEIEQWWAARQEAA
jgi:hypothetical protein